MCPRSRVFCECVSFPVGVNRRQRGRVVESVLLCAALGASELIGVSASRTVCGVVVAAGRCIVCDVCVCVRRACFSSCCCFVFLFL